MFENVRLSPAFLIRPSATFPPGEGTDLATGQNYLHLPPIGVWTTARVVSTRGMMWFAKKESHDG